VTVKQDDTIDRTGAIVLGGDYQGLGIVRSLGRHGVPVCVVDDEHSIARVSRYTSCWTRVADLGDEERLVEDLLTLGHSRGLDGWVLFPTRDETVAAISRNRERLTPRFRVPTAPWEAIQWAWDKRKTYELAASLGIPSPRTWRPVTVADVEKIEGQPPFVIKPAIKERFFYKTKAKAWRANSSEELRDQVEKAMQIIDADEVLVQELIPGDGEQQYAYCALFEQGEPVATMVARRLRQHPPDFGRASTYVETVDAPPVERLAETLLAEIGFSGLAELEFKLDPRSDEFKLLDFNARTWGYHSVAGPAGVDFPYLLFRRELKQPVERRRARSGVSWVRLLTDLPTAIGEICRGRLRTGAYLRTLRRAEVEAVFSREDPLPGLAELAMIPYLAVKRGL
jgi:predicted ATP-grasp superfamily ATP-dependent carboligase